MLRHEGDAQYSELLSVVVGDGADVTLVTVQEWDDTALHLGQHDVVVGRDATVRHIAVTLGGGIVRLNTNASYAGPGGSFEALGVYFADAGQHQEHRLFVDHEAPHCRSNVEYKGALQGDSAHTVWVGDVLIRASAEGTDTYELNRNLILTDGARADSVPNLEIETGEIAGAGHASATGRFDDQQLFYLQARGIDEDTARRLVVRGFFASIVGRIGVPEIEEHLMDGHRPRAGGHGVSETTRSQTTDAFVRVCSLDELPTVGAAAADIDGRDRRARPHGARARSTPSTTPAPTPTSRCPRASSTAAPSSAGSTARASTSAPATPSGPPATVPIAVHTVKIEGDDVYVALNQKD